MNKIISEFTKKLTITMIVLICSFILLAPTADALEYDWKKPPKQHAILPSGDIDPWDVEKVNYPLPSYEENRFNRMFRNSIFGFTNFLYIKLGWSFEITQFDDLPIINDNIITTDDSENNSTQTNTNR